ncbi:hypothetical protein TWF694_007848 [Orbilia ellipsospora]|uniref:Uncharacterized protein n=1 Tax=Orbilia ellipsospora TaxID=2528407 RepID=A0AAV9XIX2_9PEZI
MFEDYHRIWTRHEKSLHGRVEERFRDYFIEQAKQSTHVRVLEISETADCQVRTFDDDIDLVNHLSLRQLSDKTVFRLIELEELRIDKTGELKRTPPTLNISPDALRFLSAELNIDPLMLLWDEPQPPYLGNPVVGIQERGDVSALIAQTIPRTTLLESRYLYTLDREFKPELLKNEFQHRVPYRFFFTFHKNAVIVLAISYKGCKDKPIDLASSSRFCWSEVIADCTSSLPANKRLLVYYMQMTLEDVTIGWSRCTSWFSGEIRTAIRAVADYPEYTIETLTELSLEGFKCLDMILSLRRWSRIIEDYSVDQDNIIFLSDGWIRLNRRFDMIIQQHELLEKQIANAHAMITARISLKDVKSMNRLAYLGAFFLPGAFIAAFFGMNLNSISNAQLPLWIFFAVAIPSTLLTFVGLFYGEELLDLIKRFGQFLGSIWQKLPRDRKVSGVTGAIP